MSVLQTIFNPSLINKPLFIEDFVNEETNYDKLLEEWEKKMVFNNYENDEENNENV